MGFVEEAAFELAIEIDGSVSGCSHLNRQLVGGEGVGVCFINM